MLKSGRPIGENSFEISIGAYDLFSKLVLIINGKSDGSAELYHNIKPFMVKVIVNLGNININRLKTIVISVIMITYVCFDFIFNTMI